MTPAELKQKSKFLSYHLRHAPEKIGLTLEPGGWVLVTDLLNGCRDHGNDITIEQLKEVVQSNDKKRFAFDENCVKIRANQGHSVDVDLQLQPSSPPALLYHGTAIQNVTSIRQQGLQKRGRHHVHLSADVETATKVGQRHGKVVIFTVRSQEMQDAGYEFYCSANGVWLVDSVPPEFLNPVPHSQDV